MTKYAYTISSAFPNGKVDTDRLAQEIRASVIVTALDHIATSGDTCDIWFKATLSGGDESILSALVAAHSGEPLPIASEQRASDGKLYVSPDIWPLGTLTNFCGAADTVSDGTNGTDPLMMESTQVEEKIKIIQFIKTVRLAGGHLQYVGAVLGDWLSFLVYVPATSGTSNPGHGSYAKTSIGGGVNLFLPYPNGGWDLDLTEKENSNVSFVKVRPVPAPGGDGFFDWNEETGAVTPNAAQKGGYHLIDQDIPLSEFVTKVHIMGTDHFPLTIPAVRPVLMLPQWKCKITMKNSTAKTLQLAAMLYLGKANTL